MSLADVHPLESPTTALPVVGQPKPDPAPWRHVMLPRACWAAAGCGAVILATLGILSACGDRDISPTAVWAVMFCVGFLLILALLGGQRAEIQQLRREVALLQAQAQGFSVEWRANMRSLPGIIDEFGNQVATETRLATMHRAAGTTGSARGIAPVTYLRSAGPQ